MEKCLICRKPTRSHEVRGGFVCHTCWLQNPEVRKKYEPVEAANLSDSDYAEIMKD